MRRILAVLVVGVVSVGVTATPALAAPTGARGLGGGVTIRNDPNDTSAVLDIWQVASDLARRRVFLAVATYDPFTEADLDGRNGSYFVFLLDTKRRGAADKYVYAYWDSVEGRFECSLFNRGGGFKGERRVFDRGSDFVACVLPRNWFDISKEVKFGVESYDVNFFTDRAPNNGRYRGL
jgi:hypothetical protein